jgi:hypothetical protein
MAECLLAMLRRSLFIIYYPNNSYTILYNRKDENTINSVIILQLYISNITVTEEIAAYIMENYEILPYQLFYRNYPFSCSKREDLCYMRRYNGNPRDSMKQIIQQIKILYRSLPVN